MGSVSGHRFSDAVSPTIDPPSGAGVDLLVCAKSALRPEITAFTFFGIPEKEFFRQPRNFAVEPVFVAFITPESEW